MTAPVRPTPSPTLGIQILGPLTVSVAGTPVSLGGLKQRSVLALLLTNRSRVTSQAALGNAVWNDEPPATASSIVQVYISALRKAINHPALALHTVAPGYRLTVAADVLDLDRFDAARLAGQIATAGHDLEQASRAYSLALAQWSGAAMADFRGLRFADEFAVALDELRLHTLSARIDADLGCGRDDQLISELLTITAEHPLREPFWVQLITALYRTGRQTDALAQYRKVSRRLQDDLGLDPGPDLQHLQRAILRQETIGSSTAHHVAVGRTIAENRPSAPVARLVGADRTVVPIPAHGLRIGRSPENDLVLNEPKVSRVHASILNVNDHFVITDLNSTNGTAIGGRRISRVHRLADGDEITVGGSVFTFQFRLDASAEL
jgi:DNA-binding SARP family transcriptional activator